MKKKRLKCLTLIQLLLTSTVVFYSFDTATASFSETSSGPDTVTFIHVTDTHVCNLTGYHPFFVQKRQHFGQGSEPFSKFLNTVPKKNKADFVVITGDNVDFYESETAKGGILDTQIEQYTRLLNLSKFPVYLTLGNHDLSSFWVNSDSTYINNQFHAEKARAAWIRNTPCFKDGTYYSRVLKIDSTTFRLIFLDNGYYSKEKITDGLLPFIIDESQLLWLDDQLKTSTTDVEIIFMHMPLPYVKPIDNSILIEPIGEYLSKTKSNNLLTVLEKNSSTRLLFVGHKHSNFIKNYIFPNGNKLTQVMTGAFGYNIEDWRMIKLTNSNIIISSPGSSETEYTIPIR